jgi:UDP-N-acetylmuramoyl-L-alanyl-D-glutamate--2,6-diaminopimelate ligase
MKSFLRSLLPAPLLSAYHLLFAYAGALLYGNPSRALIVIAVTGTKGKSSVVELVAEALRGTGLKVASASTIRFRVGDEEERNLFKMTMPGRFFLQKFLRRAVAAGCTHAVIEMTSEGALQHRHKSISLNALVFTNLQKEHLERHGSMEAYAEAKLSLARHLEHSRKRPRIIVANIDDAYGEAFLDHSVEIKAPFSLKNAEPYTTDDKGVRFVWKRGDLFSIPLPGLFNLYNCLATLALCEALELDLARVRKALERMTLIEGRAQSIGKAPFSVIVDYAHTPDSLRALYETYKHRRIIALLGNTGGGRDTWKRPEMGAIADQYASVAILANEDPYDENPQHIVEAMAKGFTKNTPRIILDRRSAIAAALKEAREGDAVLITGKGTDPYIMGANGSKQEWSDSKVALEELNKLGYN